MKPAARNALIGVSLLLLALASLAAVTIARAAQAAPSPAAAEAPRPAVRDLLAHGTDQVIWTADVVSRPGRANQIGISTQVRYRSAGDQQRWQAAAELSARPLSLANRGSELLVVTDDGEWKIVSDSGARSGNPLPNNARVIALAGDGDDIWAVGARDLSRPTAAAAAAAPTVPGSASAPVATRPTAAAETPSVPGTSGPATISATARTPSATRSSISALPPASLPPSPPRPAGQMVATTSNAPPATQPQPLGLFLLRRGAWAEVSDLPVNVKSERVAAVSLAVLDRRLTLAIVGPEPAVRIYTRDGDRWTGPTDVAILGSGARMKLLDVRGQPALWLADAGSPGSIYYLKDNQWGPPVKLQSSGKLQPFDRASLASALGQLRLLASDGKGRLAEQLYATDGSLIGEASEAFTVSTEAEQRLARVLRFILLAVLVVWMFGALRQRPNLQEAIKRLDTLNLAPLGRRLIGGAIDALPLIVGSAVALLVLPEHGNPPPGIVEVSAAEIAWFVGGLTVYFVHVTLTEVIAGRSVGKMLTGTRVASLTGARPTPGQVVTRNLMRIVDLAGVPLLSVLSPLRQRVGDMTAGTIVVTNTGEPPPPPADDAPPADGPTAPPPPPPPAEPPSTPPPSA